MKKIFLLIIAIIHSITLLGQDSITTKLTDKYIAIKGTKISLIPPKGFIIASNFLGFQENQSGSTIMVLDIPSPFSEILKGLTKEALLSQGITTVNEIKNLIFNALPAILIKGEQKAHGNTYTKYIFAFSIGKETIFINGSFPENIKQLDNEIKQSLLSSVYDLERTINPFETVDFKISTEGTGIVFAKSMSNMLIYSRDGKIPTESIDQSTLIIAKSFSKEIRNNKKEFALNRIKQFPIEIIKIISIKLIEIDGISGYEIIADGKDKKDNTLEKVYQVILFTDFLYYILLGTSKTDFNNNIDMFRYISKTFKLK